MPSIQQSNETNLWIRQFLYLCLLTASVNLLQTVSGVLLGLRASSPLLIIFGLDSFVGALRELVVARRIACYGPADGDPSESGVPFTLIACGYFTVSFFALGFGLIALLQGREPTPSILGVGLAAVSMLLIPIIGSYMKAVAMEVRSPVLKAASVFTFGNSYLAMVLLIGLLVNSGMQHWWGDPLGALVMCPFIIQKGIQILIGKREIEFVDDARL